ncbi:MAG: P1 family peptidase [Deltaproteobacteria bacterium]|nr:MAG: P1 family peptidase [Deltaproteobacteria bacterium]
MIQTGYITDVSGLFVGHYTDTLGGTGVTAVLTPQGAVPGIYIAGYGPATCETDIINERSAISCAHAVVLSGGSAMGLSASHGVREWLRENGYGLKIQSGQHKVVIPIVPQANIFDLFPIGRPDVYPEKEQGYAAAQAAVSGAFLVGNVGVGTGSTSGKFLGSDFSTKTGLGTASVTDGKIIVGALCVTNAIGNILHPLTREILAGARNESCEYVRFERELHDKGILPDRIHTTLTVLATNATLTKGQATRLARDAGEKAYRSCIEPCMTKKDGDTIFALSLGSEEVDEASFGKLISLAAEAIVQSILCSVSSATSVGQIPSAYDVIPTMRQSPIFQPMQASSASNISVMSAGQCFSPIFI